MQQASKGAGLVLRAAAITMLLGIPASAAPRPPHHPSVSRPASPAHPVRQARPTRPPRVPGPQSTPTALPTPTLGSDVCASPPKHIARTRIWHIFYAYPGRARNLYGSAVFRPAATSDGFDPTTESASLALLDSTGKSFIAMPELHFVKVGDREWAASNEQGFVTLQATPSGYALRFQWDNPTDFTVPANLLSGRQHLCLTIGNDGVYEGFVCQRKNGGGWLCHE